MKAKGIAAALAGAAIGASVFLGWHGLGSGFVIAGEPEKKPAVVETRTAQEQELLAALNRKDKELAAREEALARKEERLNLIKGDIDARIKELRQVHQGIESFVKRINDLNDDRTRRLVKIYESMSPEESAARIEELPRELAITILATMSEKKAAKIMGMVDVSKSVEFSESFKVKR